jgi:hypothetical protein
MASGNLGMKEIVPGLAEKRTLAGIPVFFAHHTADPDLAVAEGASRAVQATEPSGFECGLIPRKSWLDSSSHHFPGSHPQLRNLKR